MNYKFLILGGDMRLLSVADEFIKDGFDVSIYGIDEKYFEKPYNIYKDMTKAITENNIIITGLPLTKDSIFINAPCFSGEIRLDDFISLSDGTKTVFGGMISNDFKNKAKERNIKIYDYYDREELIIKNVIPTVEGALSIAIEETPFTVHGSKCLVCGFGRIGKILSKTLQSVGANVTVSARKPEDIAWAECYGYKCIHTAEIEKNVNIYDIIFNTVPFNILSHSCIDKINKNAVIIDLASKPGGLDFVYANSKGLKTVWALSLPGKTAPQTAGIIIKNTISNILTDLEE